MLRLKTSADRNSLSGKMSLSPETQTRTTTLSSGSSSPGLAKSRFDAEWQTISSRTGRLTKRTAVCCCLPQWRIQEHRTGTAPVRQMEQTLRNHGIIPQGQVSTPSLRGVDDGTASWLHRYYRVGWATSLSTTTISGPQRSITSQYASASPWRLLHSTASSSRLAQGRMLARSSCQAEWGVE